MGIDSLNKDTSGAALITNFKDIFPGKLEKLFIYKGVNLVSKGNKVFSREDTTTHIALEKLVEVDAIFGGESLTSTIRTITESKNVKETARQKISTNSVTAFLADLGNVDLTQHNLYYTVGTEFVQGDLTEDQLNVLSDAQITPNLLEKLLTGTSPLSVPQVNLIKNNRSVSFTLSPAVLDNNLPASSIRFVDSTIYKVLPSDAPDFEITSLDIESDQTLALEYRNGIKARGIIENSIGNISEQDLDFRMDKPLLPLQVNPFSKNGNIQFAIENFNYYQRMPYISAKHFLSSDRSIDTFIIGSADITKPENAWISDLAIAVVDMFKMSWAISTGFSAYRDPANNNEINNAIIGGVSLKTMEGKKPEELYSYVDQVLRNWEYKNNVKNKKTPEYQRALQVLAASSEILQSSYCVGKGLTEFHKTIFDYWLDLNTIINKDTAKISMTLTSQKYIFTYEQDGNGDNDLSKPIINLAPFLDISRSSVTNYGRLVSLSELDDPISITGFTNFAGDIDPTKADATKYFIGIDVTDSDKIARLLVNEENDKPQTLDKNFEYDSSWYVPNVDAGIYTAILADGQNYKSFNIKPSGKMATGNPTITPLPTIEERNKLITAELDIPKNAINIKIDFSKVTSIEEDKGDILYVVPPDKYGGKGGKQTLLHPVKIIRYIGTVVTYQIKTTVHGMVDKKQTYDKGEFLNMVQTFSDDVLWKRNFELDENWRDENDNQNVKIKSIDHIFISSFLGNYIDIKLNYKYKDKQGVEQTGTTLLPRIDLPAKDDERRTKLGIRL